VKKIEIQILVEKAKKSLKSAGLLIKEGDYESSISSAYYAMFFMVEALLLTKNIKPKSHKGTISQFGEHFIKTNLFPKELGSALRKTFDKRQESVYGYTIMSSGDKANETLKIANKFVDNLFEYLKINNFLNNSSLK